MADSFTYLTNVHMFNRILTHDEMVSMTDCSWSPLPQGGIFIWDDFDRTFYGSYNPWVKIPNDLICPDPSKRGYTFLPGNVFPLSKAYEVCKIIGAELLSIETEEEFQEVGVVLRGVVEDYVNKYSPENFARPNGWQMQYMWEGGGIPSWISLRRNRTANNNSDPFYNPHTGTFRCIKLFQKFNCNIKKSSLFDLV